MSQHALFSLPLPLPLSSFSFATGDRVKVLLPTHQHVQGVFHGFTPDGLGSVELKGWSPVPYTPGQCFAFPLHWINAIQPRAQPKVVPVPVPAPAPAPAPAPTPVPAPSQEVERVPEEVQTALENGALEAFVTRAAYVATERARLREKMSTPTGQYSVRVRHPAFVLVQVGGKTMRSSVPFALGKRTAEFRTRLLERLGFVPPGTYVRFNWEFKRGPNGKPLEGDGDVEIFLKWGGEVQKKD